MSFFTEKIIFSARSGTKDVLERLCEQQSDRFESSSHVCRIALERYFRELRREGVYVSLRKKDEVNRYE